MGIIGMKILGRGRLLSNWIPQPIEVQKKMWEGMVLAPTPGTLTMREAMYYTLSRPVRVQSLLAAIPFRSLKRM
jgi:hypothetical protein